MEDRFHRVKTMFPVIREVDLTKLQLSDQGVYSSTPFVHNFKISRRIYTALQCQGKITIADMNGGNGADTLGFAMGSFNVLSFEIDEKEFNILKSNVEQYPEHIRNRIQLFNTDSMSQINRLKEEKVNVVYFDPPWGGKDYKESMENDMYYNLYIGDDDIDECLEKVFSEVETVKLICCKVPKGFHLQTQRNKDRQSFKKFDVWYVY